jgi:hypothetical protein
MRSYEIEVLHEGAVWDKIKKALKAGSLAGFVLTGAMAAGSDSAEASQCEIDRAQDVVVCSVDEGKIWAHIYDEFGNKRSKSDIKRILNDKYKELKKQYQQKYGSSGYEVGPQTDQDAAREKRADAYEAKARELWAEAQRINRHVTNAYKGMNAGAVQMGVPQRLQQLQNRAEALEREARELYQISQDLRM